MRETLSEAESPTRAGPMVRQEPLLRQLTGVTIGQQKNPIERELDTLGITRGQILPSTGHAEADRLIAKHMGPITEIAGNRVVQNPKYRKLSEGGKIEVMRQMFAEIRAVARERAEEENPEIFRKIKIEKLPLGQRMLLKESEIKRIKEQETRRIGQENARVIDSAIIRSLQGGQITP